MDPEGVQSGEPQYGSLFSNSPKYVSIPNFPCVLKSFSSLSPTSPVCCCCFPYCPGVGEVSKLLLPVAARLNRGWDQLKIVAAAAETMGRGVGSSTLHSPLGPDIGRGNPCHCFCVSPAPIQLGRSSFEAFFTPKQQGKLQWQAQEGGHMREGREEECLGEEGVWILTWFGDL